MRMIYHNNYYAMKKNISFSLFFLLIAVGCIKDYSFKYNQSVTPKIVVNAIFNPDSIMKIDIHWSKKVDGTNSFARVAGAMVILYRDGTKIGQVTSTTGESYMFLDHYPVVGSEYSITVDLPGHEQVIASTKIPPRPIFESAHKRSIFEPNRSYNYYSISKISVPDEQNAVIHVVVTSIFEEQYRDREWDYYPSVEGVYISSPYIDPFNSSIDFASNANYSGSVEFYSPLFRIEGRNLAKAFPLSLSTNTGPSKFLYVGEYDAEQTEIFMDQYVSARNTSPEYDLYIVSLVNYDLYNNGSFSILANQFGTIYSNVKNGLGIFASYSAATDVYKFND
jgi:hypothetical protein